MIVAALGVLYIKGQVNLKLPIVIVANTLPVNTIAFHINIKCSSGGCMKKRERKSNSNQVSSQQT